MTGNALINRRKLLEVATKTCLASAPAIALLRPGAAQAAERSMEQWMEEWITGKKQLAGALHVSRFVEPVYFLTKPIGWKPANGEDGAAVDVPVGFVTDFASIPRVFWSILRPDGDYSYAAIIHDYLYWIQDRPRESCDMVLKFAMRDLSIDSVKVETIYRAVRLGGGSAWTQNTEARKRGERRVLKTFPTDPTTRWENWRKLPDVFSEFI